MTERSVVHATFVLERTYGAPRERVFAAFSDWEKKKKWFGGDSPDLTQTSMDFRVGGRDHSEGTVTSHGSTHTSRYDAIYLDIIENERIIFAYDMDMNGTHISASLTTIELTEAPGGGTRLKFTEQGAYLDGFDNPKIREDGMAGLLDLLGKSLED